VAYGFGRRCLDWFRLDPFEGERWCLALALGWAIMSLAAFGLAACGLVYRPVFYAGLVVSVATVWKHVRHFFFDFHALIQGLSLRLRGLAAFLLIIAAWRLLFMWNDPFTPVYGGDSLTYHLTVPKLWWATHGFTYIPLVFAQFPMNQNMLYLVGMALKSDVLANLISTSMTFLTACTLLVFGRRFFSLFAGLAAATLFLSASIVKEIGSAPNTDVAVGLYTGLAVCTWLIGVEQRQSRWWWLAAFFAGFAMGSKYHGVFAVGLILGASVFYRWWLGRTDGWYPSLRDIVVMSALVICGTGGWWIKNLVLVDNPFYPFFFHWFGGRDLTANVVDRFVQYSRNPLIGYGLLDFLLLPWSLIASNRFGGYLGQFILLTILLVAPGILFPGLRRQRPYQVLGGAAGLAIIFWFVSAQHLRYFVTSIILLCWINGATLDYVYCRIKIPWLRLALVPFLLLALLYHFPGLKRSYYEAWKITLGLKSREAYLQQRVPMYPVSQFLNQALPAQSKVLLFRELVAYYIDIPLVWGDPTLQGWINYDAIPDASTLLRELRTKGVTHVLNSTRSFSPLVDERYYSRRITDLMENVLQQGRRIYARDGFEVIQLPLKN